MVFTETKLGGVFVVDIEPIVDERGFFARSWCKHEFGALGVYQEFVQANVSYNASMGTLRGLHYQVAPYEEAKLVCCTSGGVYDVVVDLREESPTFCQWIGVELTGENRRMIYVPEGCAHGFVTLTDGAEMRYVMSEFYVPGAGRGVRYDDPAFGIEWPIAIDVVSESDRNWPLMPATQRAGGWSS